MIYPNCNEANDRVIDSRGRDTSYPRRRRECLSCNHRWTTYEIQLPKKDGKQIILDLAAGRLIPVEKMKETILDTIHQGMKEIVDDRFLTSSGRK